MNIKGLMERLQEIQEEQKKKGDDLNKDILLSVDTSYDDYPVYVNNCKIVCVNGFGGVITIHVDPSNDPLDFYQK